MVTYLRLLIFPVNQNLDYDYPLYKSFFSPPVFLSFLLIFGILCLAFYLIGLSYRKKTEWRLVGFGILWFFLALSVESSMIPIPMLIDEYRVYLPSVGFFIAITTWGFHQIQTYKNRKIERVVIPAVIGIVLILSYATYMRNSLWNDKVTLWDDVVRKSPNKASGYINRALAYKEKDMYENAISDFKKALSLTPNHVLAHHNLGVLYLKLGKLDDATREVQTVLNLSPDLVEAHLLLGMILGKKNRYDEAIHEFLVAEKLSARGSDVHHADFHLEFANLYYRKGRFDDALKELQIALHLKPDFAEAHRNLAVVLIKKNRFNDALRELQTAIKLKPNFADARNDLGYVYTLQGKREDALLEFQHAVRLAPENLEFARNLQKAKDAIRPPRK